MASANSNKCQPKFGVLKDGLDEVLLGSKHPVFEVVSGLERYFEAVQASQKAKKEGFDQDGKLQERLEELQTSLEAAEEELGVWEPLYESHQERLESGLRHSSTREGHEKIEKKYLAAQEQVQKLKLDISKIEDQFEAHATALGQVPDEERGLELLGELLTQVVKLDNPVTVVQVAARLHETPLQITSDNEIGKALLARYQALTGQHSLEY